MKNNVSYIAVIAISLFLLSVYNTANYLLNDMEAIKRLHRAYRGERKAEPKPPAEQSRRSSVLDGCFGICDHTIPGEPGPFFQHTKKFVDCHALWMNEAIDAPMLEASPPQTIPKELLHDFTYGGKVHVQPYASLLNQRYLGHSALDSEWGHEKLEQMVSQCRAGELDGTYGRMETSYLKMGLQQMSLAGASVLVVGSEIPWVEACVLAEGASSVTTLEYGSITSAHPKVKTLTPAEFRARYEELVEHFDAVVTFSSVEHSGLGRYGDAMNPWGDRQAVARAWCASKPGARLLLAVPVGGDAIIYNAHRVYGPVMFPHLVANWEQVWRAPGGEQVVHVFKK